MQIEIARVKLSGERFLLFPKNSKIVIDTELNLMWQRDHIAERTWFEAMSEVLQFKLGGFSDWRLPSVLELESMMEERYRPSINPIFLDRIICEYWSNEISKDIVVSRIIISSAYLVYSENGRRDINSKMYNECYVKYCRDIKPGDLA